MLPSRLILTPFRAWVSRHFRHHDSRVTPSSPGAMKSCTSSNSVAHLSGGGFVANHQDLGMVRVRRFTDQNDRVVDSTHVRRPHDVREEGELLEVPEILVEGRAQVGQPQPRPRLGAARRTGARPREPRTRPASSSAGGGSARVPPKECTRDRPTGLPSAQEAPMTTVFDDDAAAYVIRGGAPISGTLKAGGNKNAALPMLAATLLAGEAVELSNVPDIRDVRIMLELLANMGMTITDKGAGTLGGSTHRRSTNASSTPLLPARSALPSSSPARCSPAGGARSCRVREGIGSAGGRSTPTCTPSWSSAPTSRFCPTAMSLTAERGLRGSDIFLHEMSVMGTENALMAAAMAEGCTIIRNAASEPHVQELCHLLEGLGCGIRGIGTNRLEVEGQKGPGRRRRPNRARSRRGRVLHRPRRSDRRRAPHHRRTTPRPPPHDPNLFRPTGDRLAGGR